MRVLGKVPKLGAKGSFGHQVVLYLYHTFRRCKDGVRLWINFHGNGWNMQNMDANLFAHPKVCTSICKRSIPFQRFCNNAMISSIKKGGTCCQIFIQFFAGCFWNELSFKEWSLGSDNPYFLPPFFSFSFACYLTY